MSKRAPKMTKKQLKERKQAKHGAQHRNGASPGIGSASPRVVITDNDPCQEALKPGTYKLCDMVREVIEVIQVSADGSQQVISSKPLLEELMSLAAPPAPTSAKADAFGPAQSAAPFELQKLAVGAPFKKGRSDWPEGVIADVNPSGVNIAFLYHEPAAGELRNMHEGHVSIRLLCDDHTLMFLVKIGNSEWQEAPFSVGRVRPEYRVTPGDPGPGCGWVINFVMVDATTGLVCGIRSMALSRRFSCLILKGYEKQAALPEDDAAHVREIARMQKRTTAQLADVAVHRFEQGETMN